MAYGDDRPMDRLRALAPRSRGFDKPRVKRCALTYLALGWSGHVPRSLPRRLYRGAGQSALGGVGLAEPLPPAHARRRCHRHHHGPYDTSGTTPGLDHPDDLASVPEGFDGIIWTDAIETIAPAWAARQGAAAGAVR